MSAMDLPEGFKVSGTSKFTVIDPSASKADHQKAAVAGGGEAPGRAKTRLTQSTGKLVDEGAKGRIGGVLERERDPAFVEERLKVLEEALEAQKARWAAKPRVPIRITLPDGNVKEGVSWETTPMDIAMGISKQLAKQVRVECIFQVGSHPRF
jgi:hypothetical protein